MDCCVISHVHSQADPVHAMLERKNLWSLVIDSDTRHRGLGMRQRKARADMGFGASQKADLPCETTESSIKLRTKVLAARKKRKDMLARWRKSDSRRNWQSAVLYKRSKPCFALWTAGTDRFLRRRFPSAHTERPRQSEKGKLEETEAAARYLRWKTSCHPLTTNPRGHRWIASEESPMHTVSMFSFSLTITLR